MPSPRLAVVLAAAGGSWRQIVASLAGRGAGCLDNIIERESGGNVSAMNPDGAYGIPQALPGRRWPPPAPTGRTNPKTQIRWMIGYTNQTYGSPAQLNMRRPLEAVGHVQQIFGGADQHPDDAAAAVGTKVYGFSAGIERLLPRHRCCRCRWSGACGSARLSCA